MPFPAEVPVQDLYEASTTQKHNLGSVARFNTDEGIVEARYVRWNNSASIAAGFVACHAFDNDAGPWVVDTAPLAAAAAFRAQVVGVLCASMQGTATSNGATGYGWAAFYGPVTNAALAENVASNALLYVTANSAARLASIATTMVTSNGQQDAAVMGRYGATASTISRASTANVSGHYVMLFGK